MTTAQILLAWLLQKVPWIVPIPGTTKLSHLEENLRAVDFTCTAAEWEQLENEIATIPIIGDRYSAEYQRRIQR